MQNPVQVNCSANPSASAKLSPVPGVVHYPKGVQWLKVRTWLKSKGTLNVNNGWKFSTISLEVWFFLFAHVSQVQISANCLISTDTPVKRVQRVEKVFGFHLLRKEFMQDESRAIILLSISPSGFNRHLLKLLSQNSTDCKATEKFHYISILSGTSLILFSTHLHKCFLHLNLCQGLRNSQRVKDMFHWLSKLFPSLPTHINTKYTVRCRIQMTIILWLHTHNFL